LKAKKTPRRGAFLLPAILLGLVECDLRDGKIPVGLQDFEAVLFFVLEAGFGEFGGAGGNGRVLALVLECGLKTILKLPAAK
jgi:hypothetical protein